MSKKRTIFSFIISFIMVLSLVPQFSYAVDSSVSGQITGFVPYETDSYYFEGDPEEEDIASSLPDTIDVYLDGSSSATPISVSWESVEDFDGTDFYFYSMKPVWNDAYTLSPDLSEIFDVPWITVYKQEPLSEEVEPMVTEEEAEPIYIDEEEAAEEYGLTDGEDAVEEEPAEEVTEPATEEITEPAVDPAEEVVTEEPYTEDVETDEETDVSNDMAFRFFQLFADETYAAKQTNTDKVYKYLTENMGLNMAAACGVMTNINAESAMNPINLENTYNAIYGLTDSEYTKRVDAGKGSYKTRSGKRRNFKTDYCGYGLCQWTSLGRRAKLLEKVLKKGKSVGNIYMQLQFLKEELEGNYSSVMRTLKHVPNTSQGAYVAAFIFCMNFEVPANTINTSASRAKTCLSSGGYWKQYSGITAKTTDRSFLSITGYSYPETLKKKEGMDVVGYVVSNYKITKVTAKIKDMNGNTKYSKTSKPGSIVYKLVKFDDALKFAKLSTGTYKYILTAKDKHGKEVKAIHKFKVESDGKNKIHYGFCKDDGTQTDITNQTSSPTEKKSTLAIYDYNYPITLKKGKIFEIKGVVKSNYVLRKVTVKVVGYYDGKTKISASKTLKKSKTYHINKLDDDLAFGKLAKGKYRYKVIAKDQKKTKTLVNKVFRVK